MLLSFHAEYIAFLSLIYTFTKKLQKGKNS